MSSRSSRSPSKTGNLPSVSTPPDLNTLLQFLEQIVDLLERKGLLTRAELESALAQRGRVTGTKINGEGAQPVTPETSATTPQSPFHLRSAPRAQLRCRMMFSSGQVHEIGTICDLSTKGCRISCNVPVEVGKELVLSLFLPDDPWPLVVNRAEVRWARGKEIGLEFLELRAAEAERLLSFLPSSTEGGPR